MCRSRVQTAVPQTQSARERSVQAITASAEIPTSEELENEEYSLFTIYSIKGSVRPLLVTMTHNGKEVVMEIDTGSAVTILPETTYKTVATEPLQESTIKLCTYSREKLEVRGSAMCKVEYGNGTYKLPVVVLAGNGPVLLGCNWLHHIPIQWTRLFNSVLTINEPIVHLLQKYQEVFSDNIGTYTGGKVNIHIDPAVMPRFCKPTGGKVNIHIDPAVMPRFCKPRTLPFAIEEKVEAELQKLQVIEPVKYSRWAAPIVPET